ncbi:ribokinase, partial [Mycobacteroides abscessus subsp. abscessus]
VGGDGPRGMGTITVGGSGEDCIGVAPGANTAFTLDEKVHKDIICSHDGLLCQLEFPVQAALTWSRWTAAGGKQFVLNASPVPERSPDLAELA